MRSAKLSDEQVTIDGKSSQLVILRVSHQFILVVDVNDIGPPPITQRRLQH